MCCIVRCIVCCISVFLCPTHSTSVSRRCLAHYFSGTTKTLQIPSNLSSANQTRTLMSPLTDCTAVISTPDAYLPTSSHLLRHDGLFLFSGLYSISLMIVVILLYKYVHWDLWNCYSLQVTLSQCPCLAAIYYCNKMFMSCEALQSHPSFHGGICVCVYACVRACMGGGGISWQF